MLYNKIVSKEEKIAVVGLGYVGMPIAIAFAKKVHVIGYDMNKNKIAKYISGIDQTNEVGDEEIKATTVEFTDNEAKLKEAKFFIIAVPTPINSDKTPDLSPVIDASKVVGRNLVKGSIVVYESTVYPGVTEEICKKVLENESGFLCGTDFKIAYSPERINPGDKRHRLSNIIKIVSGMDVETLEEVAAVYELIIDVGVFRASSIKVAEAAKVVENSQRDINIAFMNELAMVFNRMGIDTNEVIDAMNTKWNALGFRPGLVGGHCIGVDPYYFVYEAENMGYHSQIIASGRRINDGMGEFIAENIIKFLVKLKVDVKCCKVAIMGITFKENCPDIRNSKVVDIIKVLQEYNLDICVADSYADALEVEREYGLKMVRHEEIKDVDCVVFAVAHDYFLKMNVDDMRKMYSEKSKKILFDVKGMYSKFEMEKNGFHYWSL